MSQNILDAINQITPDAPDVMIKLADQYLTDSNPRIRLACLKAITRTGFTTRYDDVNYLKNDPDKWIRVQALRALIAIGEDDEYSITSDLNTYFTDPEPLVRLEAIYTMHRYQLQSFVTVDDAFVMLWDDEARVWESRGERISTVMHELFGEFDEAQFRHEGHVDELKDNIDDLAPDTDDENEEGDYLPSSAPITTDMPDWLQETLDDSTTVDDDLPDWLAEDSDTSAEDIPDWLRETVNETPESDLPEVSFEDVPGYMVGEVDGSVDDFAKLIQEEDVDVLPEEPLAEIPDWLQDGSSEDTGIIEIDIFDEEQDEPDLEDIFPTGEEPDFDNMSPEEMMAWMESLAQRQGTDEGFTTSSDMNVESDDEGDNSGDPKIQVTG